MLCPLESVVVSLPRELGQLNHSFGPGVLRCVTRGSSLSRWDDSGTLVSPVESWGRSIEGAALGLQVSTLGSELLEVGGGSGGIWIWALLQREEICSVL